MRCCMWEYLQRMPHQNHLWYIFSLGYREKCQLKKPSPQYPQKWETIVTLISQNIHHIYSKKLFSKNGNTPKNSRLKKIETAAFLAVLFRREKPGKPGHQVSRESGPLSPKERKPKSRRSWNLKRPSVDGVDFTLWKIQGFNVSSWKT